MMSSKNNGFTADDIERYHSGQMSPQERHALEKAALDDPFLADALEGYAFTSTPVADIAAIRSRLDEKRENRKIVPFFKKYRWLSAAAVFIILAGTGWLAYKSFLSDKNSYAVVPNLDRQQQDKRDPGSANSVLDSLVTREKQGTVQTSKKQAAPEKKNLKNVEVVSGLTSDALKDSDNASLGLNSQEAKESARDDATSANETLPARRSVARNIQQGNNNEDFATNVQRQGNANMNRVASPDPRANNISNRASNISNNDREQLYYKDLNNETTTAASRVRGVDTSKSLREINVVMKPLKMDTAEVVVVGYGSQKKASERYPRVSIDTLEPAEGYGSFDVYIASNLKMPEEIKSKSLSGEVQLAFDVDNNGKPVNITVVKSLCEKCDEEAIRLLKEGPKWKKKTNKKGKITIRF